ncbi:MAG: PCRF domain-containing protein, partial [Candidatus Acidiferrales bacterium]
MAHMTLYEKLQQIEVKYEELNAQLSMPDVHSDSARYQKLAKMHSEYSEIVEKYREWKIIDADLK